MKKLITILILLVAFSASAQTKKEIASNSCRGCTGSEYCAACKNCSGCKHCAKQGGTCGVCEPTPKKSAPKKATPKKSKKKK